MRRNLNIESVELNYSPDPTFSEQLQPEPEPFPPEPEPQPPPEPEPFPPEPEPQPFPPPTSEGEIRKRLVGHDNQDLFWTRSRKSLT